MIIAATGHRPDKLGGHDNSVAENKLRLIAHDYLLKPRPQAFQISGVITGMALGWDQRVAEGALMAGIPFIAAVPFVGQENKWPPRSRRIYQELLQQAQSVHVISPGTYDPAKMHTRNEWMVDHADRIVALWNGDETGGTAACVRYAQSKNKPIDNLWSEPLRLLLAPQTDARGPPRQTPGGAAGNYRARTRKRDQALDHPPAPRHVGPAFRPGV